MPRHSAANLGTFPRPHMPVQRTAINSHCLKLAVTALLGVVMLPFGLALVATQAQAAWKGSILYTFTGGNDGATPLGGLVADKAGNLYGTTANGGGGGLGTVFELSPPKTAGQPWTETTLHAFSGPDGGQPVGTLVIASSGVLFGTANGGGTTPCYCGTAFEMTPPAVAGGAWTFSLLHSFAGGADGAYAGSPLAAGSNGKLYGVTELQGSKTGATNYGTVYELIPPAAGRTAWTETVIHHFTAPGDGQRPMGGVLVKPSGTLFGSTYNGGTHGDGTVFRLIPPAAGGTLWRETVLYSFSGTPDGYGPRGALASDAAGNIYGITESGGNPGPGLIFKLAPPVSGTTSWTETALHSFGGGINGEYPAGGVLLTRSGSLLGVVGDAADTAIWELTPPKSGSGAWTDKYVYTYIGSSNSLPLLYNGAFFTPSSQGGNSCSYNPAYGCGYIFMAAP